MNVRTFVRALCGGAVAALPLVLALACSEDPTEAGTGEPAALVLSRQTTFQSVAASFNVSVRVTDDKGTRLDVPISAVSGNEDIIKVDSTVFVRELTETRVFLRSVDFDPIGTDVVFTAASLEATLTVISLPASLAITPIADTVLSGDSAVISVDGVDANGMNFGPVPFEITDISDETIVEATPSGAAVTAKAPGVTIVTVTGPGGELTATSRFTVVPAPFQGAFTPTSGAWGDTVTITAAPGPAFDSDTDVSFDGFAPYPISSSASEIVVIAPAGITVAEMVLVGVGPDQLAFVDTLVVTDPNPMDGNEPNNGGGGGDVVLSEPDSSTIAILPFDQIISLGLDDRDDVFQVVFAVETTVDFVLDWAHTDTDLDLLFYDGNGSLIFDFGCASAAVPESCSATFAPGTYHMDVNAFDMHGHEWATARFTMTAQ